ncbi:iduronate 2-sulfatase-like [Littorina saxatilis]|uniref:Sulfatase N-terminal domain-containing protein n=1 Tax=Littorina saxatilis TaxID=31220 RepID=A0AAN9B178_9CAEN
MVNLVDRGSLLLLICAAVVTSTLAGQEKRQVHHTQAPTTHTHTDSDPLAAWMSSASKSKPNVLFLVADDLRPKLGCYGDTNMVTPNLDNLASRSVMFRQAFAQVALCAPSRTSFLTGRRPDTTRVYDLHDYWRTVAGNFTTLPQYFKNHGYIAQGVGKIFHPGQSSGKDDQHYSWNRDYYPGDSPYSGHETHKAAYRPVDTTHTKLRDMHIADFAVNFLRDHANNRDQPFFLAVGFIKPHLPFIFPKEYLDLYPLSNIHLAAHRTRPTAMPDIAFSSAGEIRAFQDVAAVPTTTSDKIFPDDFQKTLRRGYSAATSYMDAQLGRVLKALSQYGYADNTIISFLGDHGWHLGDNAEWCKHTNFEMALRIPMMLSVPGVTSHNHHFNFIDALTPGFTNNNHSQVPSPDHLTDELVEAIDLYPTLTELSGLPVPQTCPENSVHVLTCLEGTSLVPLVRQVRNISKDPHMQWKQAAFSQYERRKGQHPIMGYTVRTKTHRYTEWVHFDTQKWRGDFSQVMARELYQHSSDPYEFHNLAEVTSYSDTANQLSQILHNGWRKTQQDYLTTLHH